MEFGGISRAAASMNLSQPAVSKLITALEARLGFVLFKREHQRLVPTAEARIFHEATQTAFGQLDRLDQLAANLRLSAFGHLVIGSAPAAGLCIMPGIITRFQLNRPHISVALQVQSSLKLLELAVTQQIDAAVSALPLDDPTVECRTLFRAPWVCVLPQGHRLADEAVITPKHLSGEPFISLGDEDRARHRIDGIFADAGISRVLRSSTQLSLAACEFVRVGAGVTLVDQLTASAAINADLVFKPFDHPAMYEIMLLIPSARPPSSLRDEFIAYLEREFVALSASLARRFSKTGSLMEPSLLSVSQFSS